ncbi:hypothetical protein HMPREF0731_2668, partial [Pseudoroseomonas cervicalis ATCC 49957]
MATRTGPAGCIPVALPWITKRPSLYDAPHDESAEELPHAHQGPAAGRLRRAGPGARPGAGGSPPRRRLQLRQPR